MHFSIFLRNIDWKRLALRARNMVHELARLCLRFTKPVRQSRKQTALLDFRHGFRNGMNSDLRILRRPYRVFMSVRMLDPQWILGYDLRKLHLILASCADVVSCSPLGARYKTRTNPASTSLTKKWTSAAYNFLCIWHNEFGMIKVHAWLIVVFSSFWVLGQWLQ